MAKKKQTKNQEPAAGVDLKDLRSKDPKKAYAAASKKFDQDWKGVKLHETANRAELSRIKGVKNTNNGPVYVGEKRK